MRTGAIAKSACMLILLTTFIAVTAVACWAKMLDKVVAFIDNEAITHSELSSMHEETSAIRPSITKREVLQTMINRNLMLREARRLRLEGIDDDALLEEYIDIKIRAFARVDERAIRAYYNENREELSRVPYDDARNSIETYLREKEVNRMLREHINELRSRAYIKVLLE